MTQPTAINVMPGLVPGIHVLATNQDVDGRDKLGHDGVERSATTLKSPSASGKPSCRPTSAAIFAAAGLTREHANEWAKMLVWANLRGTDSHGIIRIPRYIDLINAQIDQPRARYPRRAQAGAGRGRAGGRPRPSAVA